MAVSNIRVPLFTCEQCGWNWTARRNDVTRTLPDPQQCPRCRSPYWNDADRAQVSPLTDRKGLPLERVKLK